MEALSFLLIGSALCLWLGLLAYACMRPPSAVALQCISREITRDRTHSNLHASASWTLSHPIAAYAPAHAPAAGASDPGLARADGLVEDETAKQPLRATSAIFGAARSRSSSVSSLVFGKPCRTPPPTVALSLALSLAPPRPSLCLSSSPSS